ncbi:MAG: hypothetical protein APF81_13010 [Desulfosporosinus sp. BRH_c37]|nr:MAG: hypothetical protein APF81_13010 [Desulfosporosinus sp. BRH_c37]
MEMPELDKKIKRALLCKTNGILPSEETFTQILASLEKKQARRTFNISYKNYIIAFICAVSVIFGTTLIVSVDARASAMEIINTVKSVIILDKSNNVAERNADEIFMKHAISNNNQPGNADILKKPGVNTLFLQAILLNQVNGLKLCLKLLAIGSMTFGQTWNYNRVRHGRGQVPSY